MEQDREKLRAFLRELRYAPQSSLQDRDLDALLRPSVAPIWRWVCLHVHNADELRRVQRSVRLAQRRLASCQREREAAARDVDRLAARRSQLLDALRSAESRERALIASLEAVELGRADRAEERADERQRRALQLAAAKEGDEEARRIAEGVGVVKDAVLGEKEVKEEVEGDRNPLDVLLREYVRLLSAQEAESVEFGASDIAHVRRYGGRTLLRWLEETAARPVELRDDDPEEAQYAAHVEQRAMSSREALEQVRAHLRRHQKEHIARFADTQTTYTRAAELTRELREFEAVTTGMEGVSPAVKEAVELEMANAVERAALAAAVDVYGSMSEQVETARKQKQALEQQLETMDSFERRQQQVLDHIRVMYTENRNIMGSVAAKQQEVCNFAQEKVRDQFGSGKTGQLLQRRQTLAMEELRQLASMRDQPLSDIFDVAFLPSIETSGDGDHEMNGIRQQLDLLVPFAELSINQLKRGRSEANSAKTHPLDQVFSALGVPTYKNWNAFSHRLDDLEAHQTSSEDEAQVRELIARLSRELEDEKQGDAPHTTKRASAVVEELRHVMNTSEASAAPLLEEAMRAYQEAREQLVPRLNELADDFYSQRGWAVDI